MIFAKCMLPRRSNILKSWHFHDESESAIRFSINLHMRDFHDFPYWRFRKIAENNIFHRFEFTETRGWKMKYQKSLRNIFSHTMTCRTHSLSQHGMGSFTPNISCKETKYSCFFIIFKIRHIPSIEFFDLFSKKSKKNQKVSSRFFFQM